MDALRKEGIIRNVNADNYCVKNKTARVLNKGMNVLSKENDRKGDNGVQEKVSEDANFYENLQFEFDFLS